MLATTSEIRRTEIVETIQPIEGNYKRALQHKKGELDGKSKRKDERRAEDEAEEPSLVHDGITLAVYEMA